MELEEGDIALCTVERIEKTNIFVKIHHQGKDIQGSIVMSEVAPGRIRNIRKYVAPNKKIVCKVLRISPHRIELSLRRVTEKEKKQVMQQYKQEKSYVNVIKTIAKDKADKIIKDIEKEDTVYNFLEKAKENPKPLQKIAGKKLTDKIVEIIKKTKKKQRTLKKKFELTTTEPNGLELIKNLLKKTEKNMEVDYTAAGKYLLQITTENLKKADKKAMKFLDDIKEQAKKKDIEFNLIDKK